MATPELAFVPSFHPSVVRLHRPTYEDFAQHYLNGDKPVIITGALDNWKARHWTPQTFARRFPDLPVEIDGKTYLMPKFIDLVLHSSDENPAPYLRSKKLYMYFPQLLSEIEPTPPYFLPNWLDGPGARVFEKRFHRGAPALFIGGRGGKFPYMHFDGAHTQAFICQLYGTKKFYTYPANQTSYLYVNERYNISAIPDVDHPDFKKFPLFARATQTRFTLEPGEILYMPPGLWHTTKMLSPSISIAMNRANAANWSSFTHDAIVRVPWYLKPPTAAYMFTMGKFRQALGH
jgi:hypothetical protein